MVVDLNSVYDNEFLFFNVQFVVVLASNSGVVLILGFSSGVVVELSLLVDSPLLFKFVAGNFDKGSVFWGSELKRSCIVNRFMTLLKI